MKLWKSLKQLSSKYCIDDQKEVADFLNEIHLKKGSIYEEDVITQIIRYLIANAKKESNKKAVLIIDDLDRIDREHIFRILNILSVHNDYYPDHENKFGLDKTILVCDINNIRDSYKNRYGINADFNGYIDKFYSKKIFYFDNENQIIRKLTDIISEISYNNDIITNKSFVSHRVLVYILSACIQTKTLNMRDIVRFQNEFVVNKQVKYKGFKFDVSKIPAFLIIEFLRQIFDSKNGLEDIINTLSNKHDVIRNYDINFEKDEFLGVFIALADFSNNEFKERSTEYNYQNIKYNLSEGYYSGTARIKTPLSEMNNINLFDVMQEAYNNYLTHFLELK